MGPLARSAGELEELQTLMIMQLSVLLKKLSKAFVVTLSNTCSTNVKLMHDTMSQDDLMYE